MHQFTCGVNEQIIVGDYRVEILEVNEEDVCFGIMFDGDQHPRHQVWLPRADVAAALRSQPGALVAQQSR